MPNEWSNFGILSFARDFTGNLIGWAVLACLLRLTNSHSFRVKGLITMLSEVAVCTAIENSVSSHSRRSWPDIFHAFGSIVQCFFGGIECLWDFSEIFSFRKFSPLPATSSSSLLAESEKKFEGFFFGLWHTAKCSPIHSTRWFYVIFNSWISFNFPPFDSVHLLSSHYFDTLWILYWYICSFLKHSFVHLSALTSCCTEKENWNFVQAASVGAQWNVSSVCWLYWLLIREFDNPCLQAATSTSAWPATRQRGDE